MGLQPCPQDSDWCSWRKAGRPAQGGKVGPGQALCGGWRSMADTRGRFSRGRGEVAPESDPGPQGRAGLCLGSSWSPSEVSFQVCPPGVPSRCLPPGVSLQACPPGVFLQACPPGVFLQVFLSEATQKPCPWALPHQGRHNRKTTLPPLPGPRPQSHWQKPVEDEMELAGCGPHVGGQAEPAGSVTLASGHVFLQALRGYACEHPSAQPPQAAQGQAR